MNFTHNKSFIQIQYNTIQKTKNKSIINCRFVCKSKFDFVNQNLQIKYDMLQIKWNILDMKTAVSAQNRRLSNGTHTSTYIHICKCCA